MIHELNCDRESLPQAACRALFRLSREHISQPPGRLSGQLRTRRPAREQLGALTRCINCFVRLAPSCGAQVSGCADGSVAMEAGSDGESPPSPPPPSPRAPPDHRPRPPRPRSFELGHGSTRRHLSALAWLALPPPPRFLRPTSARRRPT